MTCPLNATNLLTTRSTSSLNHHPHRSGFSRISVLLALVGFLGKLVAGESGVIPYETIAKIFDGFAALKEKDKLLFIVKVMPAKSVTAVAPITLEIQSTKSRIPLSRSAAGEMLNFPLTAELRTENPRVVSNEAKGALSLQAEIQIKYSGRLSESAAWYEAGLRQVNAAIASRAGLLSCAAPKQKAVLFRFDPSKAVTVSIRTAKGDKSLRADEKREVRIESLDNPEFKDAQLIFSAAPDAILSK